MSLARGGKAAVLAAAGTLLFLYLTLLFIPAGSLLQAAAAGLAQHGLTLGVAECRRSLPLGIVGSGITLSSTAGELLKIDRARLNVRILPLLIGRLSIAMEANIGAGTLSASLSQRRTPTLTCRLHNLRLEDIPFFRSLAGMSAGGILSGRAEISGPPAHARGYVQLGVQGAELGSIKIGAIPLPDASYRSVQGMIRIRDGQATVESFSLEGNELYVRLSGKLLLAEPLPRTPLDLSLELMPKASLLDRQKLIFLLLARFQDTPGHYRIPVTGVLGKPQVS